jgi:hypothetical protein
MFASPARELPFTPEDWAITEARTRLFPAARQGHRLQRKTQVPPAGDKVKFAGANRDGVGGVATLPARSLIFKLPESLEAVVDGEGLGAKPDHS